MYGSIYEDEIPTSGSQKHDDKDDGYFRSLKYLNIDLAFTSPLQGRYILNGYESGRLSLGGSLLLQLIAG